ncbi:MAG: LacI family DNA-binding transcriptional regulator [Lachnospiraceae bacterium]|nr:LacI family DNA-binding transcriptional regulator [Lachnospiraceae bacterium]
MASIKDVARLAGVSPSTVSLAMNGSPLVKHETRYRIMQAVEELNYKPNQAARSLVTKEKKVIGLFLLSGEESLTDFSQPFSHTQDTLLVEMLPFVQKTLREADYSILVDLFFSGPQTEHPENHQLNRNSIDGAIFFGGLVNEIQLQNIHNTKVPSVLVCSRDNNLDYVDTDPKEGIRLATQYLIQNGHHHIALLNGSDRSQVSARKLAGYRQALEENGISYDESLVESSAGSGDHALSAIEKLWDRVPHPTAIITASEYTGCAALRFLYDRGLSCPDDVSVISFGDGPVTAYTAPALTTINLHKQRLGEEAANILINRLKNPKARQVELIIPPELTIRDSVKCIL